MSKLIKSFYTVATSPYLVDNNEKLSDLEEDYIDSTEQRTKETEFSLDMEMIKAKIDKETASILAQARIDANRVLESAQQEAEDRKKQIYDRAYKQGYNDGMEQVKLEGEKIIEEANLIITTAYEKKEEILKTLEPEITELIIKIVKKIVLMEMTNSEQVLYSIKNAFAKINRQERLKIRVSPLDLDVVRKARKNLVDWDISPYIELESDNLVESGGCILETQYGNVDARISSQLTEMERVIRGEGSSD